MSANYRPTVEDFTRFPVRPRPSREGKLDAKGQTLTQRKRAKNARRIGRRIARDCK